MGEFPAPRNFVLVHGAWHGGWCWQRVSDLLAARGHRVFTPTLTGLGERSHLLSPAVNLATHIADVVNLIEWEGLEKVVLCGHSYGGLVISGVVEEMLPAIAALVFLDAFVPEDGESWGDVTSGATRDAMEAAARRGDIAIPPRSAAAFQVNERDRAWVDAKCTPHPMGTFSQKLRLTGKRERIAKKAYIRASTYNAPVFARYYAKLAADPSWRCYEVACGHDVMVDMPERLAAILEEVA
jgi:pimeloyl-ACP methyl ester carboxylesterase